MKRRKSKLKKLDIFRITEQPEDVNSKSEDSLAFDKYYNAGLEQAKKENYDEAIELLNKAVARNPKHINSYNVLGKIYVQKDEFYAARACWRKSLLTDPDNEVAYQCLEAINFESLRDRLQAFLLPIVIVLIIAVLIVSNVILLRRINQLETELPKTKASGSNKSDAGLTDAEITIPKLESIDQVAETYDHALANCKDGSYNLAASMFSRILEFPPSHPLKDNAQYWLAECYYAQDNYSKALTEFRKVKMYFPESDKIFDAELKVAYTYFKLNRIELAKGKISELIKEWSDQQYQARIAILANEIQSGNSLSDETIGQ